MARLASGCLCVLFGGSLLTNLVLFQALVPRWRDLKAAFLPANVSNHSVTETTSAAVTAAVKSEKVDCWANNKLLVGQLKINQTCAEKSYWVMSNVKQSDILASEAGSKFLGPHNSSVGNDTRNIPEVLPFRVGSMDSCLPSYSIAIVIPFRNREAHLRILLGHLVPILERQPVKYAIFVVEQSGNGTFNKGRLMNTGFRFAAATARRLKAKFDCFFFHDVDLLAEYDTLLYRCPPGDSAYHLSTTIDIYKYRRLCCGITVGGVLAFTEMSYRKVNGFSNSYWGWGGEDDDMFKRLLRQRIKIVRPDDRLGRYTMIKHGRDHNNPKNDHRLELLKAAEERMKIDGLSSIDTKITKIKKFPMFVKLLVDVGELS